MNKYYLYILIAASFWGSIGIIVKGFYAAGFTPIQLVCFRTFLGASLIFIYLIIKGRNKLKIKLRDSWMFLGTGIISFAFFNVCYFIAVDKTGLSVASVLLYTAPGFVFILSVIIFKEKITKVKMLALFLAFFGCLLVSGVFQGSESTLDIHGIIIGVFAGFGYGLYSVFGKIALSKYDSLTVTFYTFVFGFLFSVPFSEVAKIPIMLTSGEIPTNIILLAIFITTLPFALYTKGLSKVTPSRASILATIEPVVATILGSLLFNETLTIIKILGIISVISASIIINYKPKTFKSSFEDKTVSSLDIFRYEGKILFGLKDYVGVESRISATLGNGVQIDFPCTSVHLDELAIGVAFSQNPLKLKPNDTIFPYDQISYEKILICYQNFSSASPIFRLTGSVHSGILMDANYKELFFTEDMSRHNVIDKIIGFGIKNEIEFNHCILMISSRMPLELIEKAYKSGIRNIASVSAPTKDSILFARKNHINLVGMYRDSRFNVYSKL